MKLEAHPRAMILATAIALAGCGDDGPAPQGDGSTGGSTAGTTEDDSTPGSTSALPSTGSTSSAESSSTTTTSGGSDSGSSSSTSTTGGSEDTGDATSTGTGPTAMISGIVSDFLMATPLENIDVCVFGQDGIPCATTDAAGVYSLAGVPVAEGAIEFTGNGRFPSLFWGEGPMDDQVLSYRLLSNLAAAVLAASLGEEIDDNLGHLALAVTSDDALLSEVSFTMSPSSGAAGYLTMDGIDPQLTETTEVGFAGWLNIDVGEVEIIANHPTLDCVPGPGALVGATPNALRIDITAGYLGSTFPFVCS